RAQNAHRPFAVLVLSALVLAGDHDSRRDVRNPHRRIRCVDVLSALAPGAIGVGANVFRLDVDFDAFVNFRRDIHAGKRRVAALGLVERRDAYQAVHTDLADQQPIGVLAIDAEGCRLDARLVAWLILIELRGETLALRPAQVHAHQHFGPILRLGAAGAGMNGHDGAALIIFAGEQRLGLQLLDQAAQGIHFAPQFSRNLFAFARQIEVSGDVAGTPRQFSLGGKQAVQALLLAHDLL